MDKPEFRVERGPAVKDEAFAIGMAKLLEREGRTIAAAELRRLHQFSEDQIGRVTAAEAALQMTKATHALKIAAVEAQRDALLRVLKDCEIALRTVAKSDDEFVMARHQVREVRAVIKAVEGEKK